MNPVRNIVSYMNGNKGDPERSCPGVSNGMNDHHPIYGRRNKMDEMFVRVHIIAQKKPLRSLSIHPFFVLALTAAVSFAGTSPATGAYFSDAEASGANILSAAPLDFSVNPGMIELALAAGGAAEVPITLTPDVASLMFEYSVIASASPSPLCTALFVNAGAPLAYSGPLTSLTTATTTSLAGWTLSLSLPDATGIVNGDTCTALLTFHGVQEGASAGTEFHDDESISLLIHADIPAPLFIESLPEASTTPENSSSDSETASSTPE